MLQKKIYALLIIAAALLSIQAITFENDKYFEILKNMEIYANVYKELNANFVDEIDPGELMKIGLDAMTDALDPYTTYISEAQVESYRISELGRYEGIGAVLETINEKVVIADAYDSSPAIKAGLRIGDEIVMINNNPTIGKNNEDVLKILRGVPGTKINLVVRRPGENKEIPVTLTREEINVPNVPHAELVNGNIAYVALTTFTANASDNIRRALVNLRKENPDLKGVILDLRNNGGGLLREAIDVSNIFIPQGLPVVSTKGKVAERNQTYSTSKNPWDTEIPLAVLINKSSASASEIVSGVIQDYDRGVLIGQRSYGKGLVQNTTIVGYNSQLKLTTSKYYIPSNRCIQSVEYENGLPKDIPDEKRTTFKTRNGRPVLDGGGVTPDVKTPETVPSEFARSLLDKYIIFDYATKYVQAHNSIAPPDQFEFNAYSEFVDFARNQDFEVEAKATDLLNQLSEASVAAGIPVEKDISNLKASLKSFYDNGFETYKEEIINLLELEIINRYYYQQGKIDYRLANDPEVNKAVEVLLSEEYSKLLQG